MTCTKCGKDKTGEATPGVCWACYQRERRAKQPPKRVPACVKPRRYHAYGLDDRCTHCGAVKVFAN